MFGFETLFPPSLTNKSEKMSEAESIFLTPIVAHELENVFDPVLMFLPNAKSATSCNRSNIDTVLLHKSETNVTPVKEKNSRSRLGSSSSSSSTIKLCIPPVPLTAMSNTTKYPVPILLKNGSNSSTSPKRRTSKSRRSRSSISKHAFLVSPGKKSEDKSYFDKPHPVDYHQEGSLKLTFPLREMPVSGPTVSAADGPKNLDKSIKWAMSTAVDKFWNGISNSDNQNHPPHPPEVEEWELFDKIYKSSTYLAESFMNTVDSSFTRKYNMKFRGQSFDAFKFLSENITGILLSANSRKGVNPSKIDEILETFYNCGFRAMNSMPDEKTEEVMSDGEECEGCGEQLCICCKIVRLFNEANLSIQGLGLMEELAGPRMYAVVSKQMAQRVEETCSGKYETSHLEDLLDWLKYRVLPWVEIVYPNSTVYSSISRHDEFSYLLLEVYGKAIISEMFSIIIEFPESQPILEDLRYCMTRTNLRHILVENLKTALEKRLLNAGVNTNSVLDAYCSTVRALKFVDASGILVQLVTPPVREYLKCREETVRVILVNLTEESGDLAEELSRNPTYAERKARLCGNTWNEWKPDPIDVPRDKYNLRKSDLIQALVSIYGSKSLFIDEYRALLADRLLKMPKPGSITREIKCLELLKLRFGDANLQKCEVMLKDVSDSQRLNTRFYEEEGAVLADEDVVVTGLVVSAQFWPNFRQESLELPQVVTNAFDKYTKAFEMIKGNRTLEWQKYVGTVEIELEHEGATISLTVTPSQAAIIWQFQEKDQWTLEELSGVVGLSQPVLKNRIGFWLAKGVLIEISPDVYHVNDSITGETDTCPSPNKYTEETDTDFPLTSTSKQRENELQIFWSYIEGMLTNLESLPLARIHSMLKLFATVECSSEALQKFLDEKVTQNLLSYSGGQYQLPK